MQTQRVLPLILNLGMKHVQHVAADLVFLIHILQHNRRKCKEGGYS